MRTARQWLFALASVASSALFVALAVHRLAWQDVVGALERAHLWPWVPLAVVLYLVGHVVRGMRCRLLVSHESLLTLPTATNVVVLGYAMNNVLPARLGELARAAMLSQKSGLPYVQSLAVTGLERILDGLVLVLLLVVSSVMLPHAAWIRATLEVGALVFGCAAAAVILALIAPSYLITIASRAGQRLGPRAHDRLVALVHQVTSAVAYLREPRAALRVLSLSCAVWLIEAGMFLALLPAFGIAGDLWLAILVMTVTNLGILVPSTPGFVGPFHFFCMRALAAFGVAESVAFSYAILAHLSFYVPITLWGLAILLWYGLSLSALRDEAAAARPLAADSEAFSRGPARPARSEPVRARPFTVALVESWLLPDEDYPERNDVVQATARFVDAELADLPARLAWLHDAGMLGFRWITALVHFRTFCNLDLAFRRRWVESWAFSRWALARQLFRATRTTALLAYYEHPVVVARLGIARERTGALPGNVVALRAGGTRG